jgi:signal transduction histidine kinase
VTKEAYCRVMDLRQLSKRTGIGLSDVAWALGLLLLGQWNLWVDWDSYVVGNLPHLTIDTVTVSIATLALLFRRRAPAAVVVVTGLAQFGPDLMVATGPVFWGEWVPFLVAAYTFAASPAYRDRMRVFVLPLLLICASFAVMAWRYPEDFWHGAAAAVWIAPALLAVAAGRSIGGLRHRSQQLTRDAEEADRSRRRDAEQAVERERARIAREVHDVIAHSVSVMVVQASAAENVLGSDPAGARTALRHVQASGREALEEMKLLLGVLRNNGDDGSRTPVPGLRRLDALVESVQRSGLRVELELRGVEHRLPPSADVAAYRVIQEALTNALRYAPGATVRVEVAVAPSSLRIEVHDDGVAGRRPPGAGQGLLGLRERLSLHGGSLEAGPAPEGGFTVRAELPLKSGLVPG